MKNLPYNHLTKFVIGCLLFVFIGTFLTEYYSSTSVLDERKLNFSCIVDYLNSKNIKDEFFTYATPVNASSCDDTINEYKFSIENEYFASKNLSAIICKAIRENPSCNSSNSTIDQSTERCLHLWDEIKSLENFSNDKPNEFFETTKKKCEHASICFNCIKATSQQSGDDDYELSMLHVMAVNLTSSVIEFRFWEYFRVTSSVGELLNDANALRDSAANECKC